MSKDLPTDLHLQFTDQNPLEIFESLKIDTLLCLGLIKVFTFTHKDFLESRQMGSLQRLAEDFRLETLELLIVQIAITVFVKDPEYPPQSFLELWLESLA